MRIWSFKTCCSIVIQLMDRHWLLLSGEALTSVEVTICVSPWIKFLKSSCNGRPAGSQLAFAPDKYLYPHHYNTAFAFSSILYLHHYRLSSQTTFPKGAIQAYPVPYVTQCQVRCPLWCGECNDHERLWGNAFPTLMPFGHSALTTSADQRITHLAWIYLHSSYWQP